MVSRLPGIPDPMEIMARVVEADQRAFETVARAKLRGCEQVLPRLSRIADHSVLWFGAAAGLAAAGRPSLRRAALRGLIGISVASPAVNLVGKQAFRRGRPLIDLVPLIRRRWRIPTSSSFPSGHSASAAAFAAGVFMEAPKPVAIPVMLTAGAVAFSRVYVGAHYPADVVAGAALGTLAGLATRMIWPVPPGPARVGRTRIVESWPGGTNGVVVVINDGAGRGSVVEAVKSGLPDAELIEVEDGADLTEVLDEAAGRARVLAVAGGDGTVNAGAQAALAHGVPLLVLPGGTLNHFARTIGLETVGDAIAAFKSGTLARVDIARIHRTDGPDVLFLNTASFAGYTELVERRQWMQRRVGKWPALAVAAVQMVRDSEPVEVLVNGRRRHVWLAFVGNSAYDSRGPAPTWRTRLDDGVLDIRMIATGRRARRTRALAALLIGHLHLTPEYAHTTPAVLRVEAVPGAPDLRLTHDGELFKAGRSATFVKNPERLGVFVAPAVTGRRVRRSAVR
jgi:diacylglycerol kinase family enzyme